MLIIRFDAPEVVTRSKDVVSIHAPGRENFLKEPGDLSHRSQDVVPNRSGLKRQIYGKFFEPGRMTTVFHRWPLAAALVASLTWLRAAEPPPGGADPESIRRGRGLYIAHCSMCHQVTGAGVPGTYPPLAKSDFLRAHPEDAIRAVVEGLDRPITVHGREYHGQMPPAVLTDEQVADVLTFVLNNWNNGGGSVSSSQVAPVRAKSRFPTFEKLSAANAYRPLPPAPEGFVLTEAARLTEFATRLASDGRSGAVYVLGQSGSIGRLDTTAHRVTPLISPQEYPAVAPGEFGTLGFTLGPDRRLWITMNQRVEGGPLISNLVSIYRTGPVPAGGKPSPPELWFRTAYPHGIGPYNHGISDIRFGPDGLLYVSSGSRTDGGESGSDPRLGSMGEVDLTAAIWRLDPQSSTPSVEVIARGIRNAYSLGWDASGTLFSVSNGPDSHAGEEMDVIVPPEPGKDPRHHGFPYQLGDVPAGKRWYPHTPDAPAGMDFVMPVANLGPDGWAETKPGTTFDPHSSPAGLAWLGDAFPERYRNAFVVGRFGNLIPTGTGQDSGFDLLLVRPRQRPDGRWEATVNTFLAPIARPLDVAVVAPGKLMVLEYTRTASFKEQIGWLPGRILELKVQPPPR